MPKRYSFVFFIVILFPAFFMPTQGMCQTSPAPEETGCLPAYRFDGKKLVLTEEQWKERLTPEQFDILRKGKTEPPHKNAYFANKAEGIYQCAGCFLPLFSSKTKYEAGTGWPSFWAPICPQNVTKKRSFNPFSSAREVVCSRCGGHLGDVFKDGPPPTGLRYCINSAALMFVPQSSQAKRP